MNNEKLKSLLTLELNSKDSAKFLNTIIFFFFCDIFISQVHNSIGKLIQNDMYTLVREINSILCNFYVFLMPLCCCTHAPKDGKILMLVVSVENLESLGGHKNSVTVGLV